jgi:Ca2+-binding RTX toxin-like protein
MLLLAGILGMMAVGATAFFGFDFGTSDENADSPLPPEPESGQPDLLSSLHQQDPSPDDTAPEAPAPDQSAPDTAFTPGEIISGDATDNSLAGTDASDQINGYAGDDLVAGGPGDDQLFGDLGQDTLLGEAGNDTLHGDEGDDSLSGQDGDDDLYGHAGQDTLSGGAGDDSLQGGEGNDSVMGDDGNDAVHGGLGDDTLDGGLGADTLFGSWGNDALTGVVDDPNTAQTDDIDAGDFLNGGGGDDVIVIGQDDTVTGGTGADSFTLGHWITQDHQAEILDFSLAEDALMVIYDDSTDPDPEVTLEPDDADAELQHLVLNGVRIAAISGAAGLTLDAIALIPESALPPPAS